MSRSTDSAGCVPAGTGNVRPLARQEFEKIRTLARGAFGLDLKAGKEDLVTARLRRLAAKGGFRTFQDYYRYVVEDTTGRSLAAMIDALATNHTSFLREPDHFDFLCRTALPQLSRRDPVEVWCAACSTGEETWTLACALSDALPAGRFRISASDISNKALQIAAQAIYPAERCGTLPREWLARYFCLEKGNPGSLRVSPKLQGAATFHRLNLIGEYRWPRQFPVIFCRNVMIYFDRSTQESVVNKLSACLEPGGYLFVGHAESLTQVSHALEYVQPAVYRKPLGKGGRWGRSS